MARLTAAQREEQFKIVETKEFKAWFDKSVDRLTGNFQDNLLQREPEKYSYYYGGSSKVDPAEYDIDRTEAIKLWEVSKRLGKPLTITVSTNLKRATEAGVEQVMGQDPRLAQFWADAQAVAKALGYCEEYAEVAKLLGGPKAQCK